MKRTKAACTPSAAVSACCHQCGQWSEDLHISDAGDLGSLRLLCERCCPCGESVDMLPLLEAEARERMAEGGRVKGTEKIPHHGSRAGRREPDGMAVFKPKGRGSEKLSSERITELQVWSGFLDDFSEAEQERFEAQFSDSPEGRQYATRFLARAKAWRERTDRTVTRATFKRQWDAENPT
jgi:hypothetical protein